MAIGDFIQQYPLLRLLLPYVCGIVLADLYYSNTGSWQDFLWGMLCIWLLMLLLHMLRRYTLCTMYGILSSVLFLALGVANYSLTRQNLSYDWPSTEALYEARVLETPRERARSTLCLADVSAVCDTSAWHSVQRKVFVYFEPSETVDSLLPGDVFCFKGKVHKPHNFSPDLTFDYAHYVAMQGASGTVYVPETKWTIVGESNLSLKSHMLRIRHRLLTGQLKPAFGDDVLGVLAALTMGEKKHLDNKLRDIYADAGAAHVLALSGMHVSVLYAMLNFMLCGLFCRRSLHWLRELLTIVVLWLFAFMVGMSASVVRAVTMCMLYSFSRWISKDTAPFNVLSLTALLMLLVDPLNLMDVGFQLSFMAMAAILCIEPYFGKLLRSLSLPTPLFYPAGLVCVSVAAQLGTFPLVLHHFGTFPTYFFVTNLIITPFVYLVLVLSIVWWLLILVYQPLAAPLTQLLQTLVHVMNVCLGHIARWPAAVLHVSDYSASMVFFTYMFVLFIALFVIKKWPKGLIGALASLLGLLLAIVHL